MGNVLAVFLFEWRRAFTGPRMFWWFALAIFPVFIAALIRFSPVPKLPPTVWAFFLYLMIPMLISMLGTFLWTTPAVSAELERKSWVYLTVRPHGSTAVLLGKYLAAISWVLPAALLGLTMAMIIAQPADFWIIWWTMVRLACLACPAYAAVYLLIGVLFPRRAMVIAVAYTLVIELLTSMVPAMINKLTVQFRLRSLLFAWAEVPVSDNEQFATILAGDASPRFNTLVLIGYATGVLLAALILIRQCEFSTAAESDV